MKKLLFLMVMVTLAFIGSNQAYADYSISFVAMDTNNLMWNLTGVLQTTVVSGQTYITGGSLQEATGPGYAFSGTTFTVLGLSPGNLHGVPLTGGADFTYDNVFYPTSNPVFSSNGIDLVNSSGPTITSDTNVPASAAPFVNIWSNGGAGGYQMQYVGTGAQGDLPYTVTGNFQATVNVTPTPIPAALYLLGPGLVGIVGLKRRFLGC